MRNLRTGQALLDGGSAYPYDLFPPHNLFLLLFNRSAHSAGPGSIIDIFQFEMISVDVVYIYIS